MKCISVEYVTPRCGVVLTEPLRRLQVYCEIHGKIEEAETLERELELMFDGIETSRVSSMSNKERRLLDNIKKALHASDCALQAGVIEDQCLPELMNAIDTAKTLRRSHRGDSTSYRDNKNRFIDFLALEIPAVRPGGFEVELREADSGELRKFGLGGIIYEIRCMVHENENLNVAEDIDYHVLVDWSERRTTIIAKVIDGRIICNGHIICSRLREVLSKFITGIESMIALANGETSFSITCRPEIGSIAPERKRNTGSKPD